MKKIKNLLQNRFKDMFIMSCNVNEIPKQNKNNLTFVPLTQNNICDFKNNDFVNLENIINHGGDFFAAYIGKTPVAFGAIQTKNIGGG